MKREILLFELFVNREDCYSIQYLQGIKKAFKSVKEPISPELIKEHLEDKTPLGVYQLDKTNKVKWGCLDFDLNTPEDFENSKKIYNFFKKSGFNPLIEKSGGGDFKVHIWIFSKELIQAKQMKDFLELVCEKAGVKPHEIFPKQTEIEEDGFGNLVKLPLGIHLVTKKRSVFLDENFEEMKDIKGLIISSRNKDTIPEYKKEQLEIPNKSIKKISSHDWDGFFESVLKIKLPKGTTKDLKIGSREAGINNNLLKNEARWLFEKGYNLEELKTKINPLFLQYGRSQSSFNNLKGWFKKCLKGDIVEISEGELIKWCNGYFPELLNKIPNYVQQEEGLEVYTDADLEKYIPEPVNWLIENQIPKAEIGLLVGKRGMRKTFTALAQAICLTSGKSFLGDMVPERKKVLIIDEENGKNEIAKRTKLLKNGMGIKENLDISFLSFENLKLNDMSSQKYLAFEDLVLELRPDLIIVDCLQRVLNIEVDRDNQGISNFFTGIARRLTQKIGCSWLFIHHMRKGNSQYKPEDQLDEIRGGSELVNYCRFVLMCEEPRKKKEEKKTMVIFQVLKMSNSQIPNPKVYEFNSNEDSISLNYLGTPEEILNTEAKIGEAIKQFVLDNEMTGEFKTKEITDNAEIIGYKKSSLSLGLNWLEEKEILIKERRGVWRLSSDEEL